MTDAPLNSLRDEVIRLRSCIEKLQLEQRQTLGVLAGGIAHEFNNLLTSILCYTELAERDMPPGVAGHGYLQEVTRAANRAANLTRQMLFYAGQGRSVLKEVDLSVLIQDLQPVLLGAVSSAAELRLECREEPIRMNADPAQVQHIVLELVRNASESLGERPGEITLRTGIQHLDGASGAVAGPFAWLEVLDTGSGMSESILPRIFDPFFTTRFPGRGLGLAAVQGIVRAHGGQLRVKSAPNQGSAFEVLFPALPGSV